MKQAFTVFCSLLLILGVEPANYSTSYSSYTQPASNDLLVSGSTGSKVKWVQAALNFCIKKKYFSASYLNVDGSYGSTTVSAVKAFQKKIFFNKRWKIRKRFN